MWQLSQATKEKVEEYIRTIRMNEAPEISKQLEQGESQNSRKEAKQNKTLADEPNEEKTPQCDSDMSNISSM